MDSHQLIDILSDGHVHTRLCNHAVGEMEEYVKSAISRGLHRIIFLEHVEKGIDYQETTWLTDTDLIYYREEGRRLQAEYEGQIELGLGIELGYNPEARAEIMAWLAEHDQVWDRIGISCHFLRLPETGRHLNLLSRKQENIALARRAGTDSLLERYFTTLIEGVELLPGNVLCHLDAALRFVDGLTFSDRHLALIDRLLRAVSQKGMALEVNSSGFRIRGEPFPRRFIIEKAVGLGIPLTAGSDAHRPQDVGNRFSDLLSFTRPVPGP